MKPMWLVFCLGTLSCAHVHRTPSTSDSPLEVTGLDVSFPEPERGVLNAQLKVTNRGTGLLELQHMEWELGLDEHLFATGLYPLSEKVPAASTVTVKLEVPLPFRNLATREKARTLRLRWKGRVWVGQGENATSLPFSGTRLKTVTGAPVFGPPPG